MIFPALSGFSPGSPMSSNSRPPHPFTPSCGAMRLTGIPYRMYFCLTLQIHHEPDNYKAVTKLKKKRTKKHLNALAVFTFPSLRMNSWF